MNRTNSSLVTFFLLMTTASVAPAETARLLILDPEATGIRFTKLPINPLKLKA